MDQTEKQSLVARMNAHSSKSFPAMRDMGDAELEEHATILQSEFRDLEQFTVPKLRNDFRYACELMKERKIKSVLVAEPQSFKSNGKAKAKPQKRMSKEERVRENGIAALMSVGISRADAEAQFGIKGK